MRRSACSAPSRHVRWGVRCARALPLVLTLVAASCGDAGGRDVVAARSEPPLVMSNDAPLLTGGSAWRVAPEPLLTIGAGEARAQAGDTLYEFNDVIGAFLLADSGIVVAVMGSSALRFYDADGRYRRSAGRKGEGPGEFRQIIAFFRLGGDTLAVNDYHREVDWFAPDGRSLRRGRSSVADAMIQTHGMTAAGIYYGVEHAGQRPRGRLQDRLLRIIRVDPIRGEVDSVATLPGIIETPRRPGMLAEMVPFTPRTYFAAFGDSILTARSTEYRFEVRSHEFRVGREIRRAHAGTAVDEALKRRYRAWALDRRDERGQPFSPRWRAQREAWLATDPFPDSLPAFQSLVTSHEQEIWVQRYSTEYEFRRNWSIAAQWHDDPTTWDVFSRDGRWITTITLPARFTLLDARGDRLLGFTVNDDEEQGVQVLRLMRPPFRAAASVPP